MLSNGWCYFQLGGGGMSGNVGGMSPNAFVGFYLRGAFQKNQINTEKILYNKSP